MTEISPRLGARVMALIDNLARHTDERVRRQAVTALGRNETPEARRALLDLARGG